MQLKMGFDILREINEKTRQHKGRLFNGHLLDSFYVENGSRKHLALAFEPLREPLWLYRERFVEHVIPSSVLKIILQMILHGLGLSPHSECHIIHTDLKPDNIMVKIEDPSILEDSAKHEYTKLFKDVDPLRDQEYNEPNHLAHIESLLGSPPKDILARGKGSGLFYTSDVELVRRQHSSLKV
ncbi:hypothetical protein BDV27DRAFT_129476 [Aspergillus caelatus]|uniref:non-specific serine/threonine protein kinase n=1 Tax=Aspergillus caelatus TaxID=61420 RepID=A0A5N7A5J8_9EURO|nr:uncharacterized protein BDV27DRAFT_129476 [Aspergillus caelatus]KAE8363790.1 hypothetical protein BDV27DRAFT_129476 [Aspergillus caelatus]